MSCMPTLEQAVLRNVAFRPRALRGNSSVAHTLLTALDASRDSVCLQYNTHSIGTNYPHSIAASMVCRFSSHRSVHASNIPRLCLTGRPAPFTDIGRATARRQTLSQRPRFPLHTVSAISPPVDPVQRLIEEDFREITKANGVIEGFWKWRDYTIRYQRCGETGPPVLLLHGFGGNCDHWRKNIPELAKSCRVFAIDLLGYGYASKPDPRQYAPNELYNFETWGEQTVEFIQTFIGEPVFLICNSVGGLAGLTAAKQDPSSVRAVQVIDISLRMLHLSKQAPWQRPLVARLQRTLRESRVGVLFFGAVAKPKAVRNILRECYGNKDAVTDELVDCILKPGLLPGAAQVFLDFISYSGGPLPEDLMREAPCPVSVLWGAKDPWEKVEWGRKFADYPTVEEYIEFPGVGHCGMDEAPELFNPAMLRFIERHAGRPSAAA